MKSAYKVYRNQLCESRRGQASTSANARGDDAFLGKVVETELSRQDQAFFLEIGAQQFGSACQSETKGDGAGHSVCDVQPFGRGWRAPVL